MHDDLRQEAQEDSDDDGSGQAHDVVVGGLVVCSGLLRCGGGEA